MSKTKHLSIVIPAYNEGAVVFDLLKRIPKKLTGIGKISVLVVDDGSIDGTAKEAKRSGATVVSLPFNNGAGTATLAGLEASQVIGADIAVTMDGDGQHSPDDLGKIIAPILEGRADLVIGTRLKKHKGMPWYKKIGNVGLNTITYVLSGKWTSDSQSGFKAFSSSALDKINLDALGYEFCSEVIMEASKAKLKIKEVPIKVIYSSYSKQKGQSILNGVNIVAKLIFKKITG